MEYAELTLMTAVILLIGSASFLGDITFTGNILLSEEACGPFGCSELCELPSDCVSGLSCCPTSWNVGFCDQEVNCEAIAIYTRTHAQEPVPPMEQVVQRISFEQQSDVSIPILISLISVSVVFIILWFIYRMPEQRMRRMQETE